MKLKITLPVKGTITQGYGGNANTYYKENRLMGHPGIDIASHYDDTITDAVLGFNKKYVYKILTPDDVMKYRGVFQIVEADDGVFEVVYGHCNKITCKYGYTEHGSVIATEGNTGLVYAGGVLVSREEKEAGSKAGTHVHFQLRRLQKTRDTTLNTLSVENGPDFIDEDGWHFDIPNYNNGYNGCIDPLPFINNVPEPTKFQFTKDLGLLSVGNEVFELQKKLVKEHYADFTPTGFFGLKTLKALKDYQGENGLPVIGRVGPLTREKLNTT